MVNNYKIATISLLLVSLSIGSLFADKNQKIIYPKGYTDIPTELYKKDKSPSGIPYTADELVLIPSGNYKVKIFDGELEVLEKINDSIYRVKPYVDFFKRIQNWYDSWFYTSGYAKPVCYLFIPYNIPDLKGADILSTAARPINIYSIENMTDDEKIIKDEKKREATPEYIVFFKCFGYLEVNGKEYPVSKQPPVKEHPDQTPNDSGDLSTTK